MLSFSRIVVFFFAFLLSIINSGLIRTTLVDNPLAEPEESYPSSHHFSIQNVFVWPASDHRLKDNLVPDKTQIIFQKTKLQWSLKPLIPSQTEIQYNPLSNNKDPKFLTDIYGPTDISFPFNYFW